MLNQKKIAGMMGAMLVALSSLSATEVMPNGCEGPVLCSQNPSLRENSCDAMWRVEAGLMYEQLFSGEQDGIAVATSAPSATDTVGTDVNPNFGYGLGLLLSVGHFMTHDNWYAEIHFDWLNNSMSEKYQETGVRYVFTDLDDASAVDYSANMTMYTLDFNLSRGSYISKTFAFEPVIGIEALWVGTSQQIGTTANTQSDDRSTRKDQTNTWGVGPRFGFNVMYEVVKDLGLFFDGSVAVLYGQFRAKSYAVNTPTTGPGTTVTKIDNELSERLFPVRTIIGVQFTRRFLEEKHLLALKVGYDARMVFYMPEEEKSVAAAGLYMNLEWSF